MDTGDRFAVPVVALGFFSDLSLKGGFSGAELKSFRERGTALIGQFAHDALPNAKVGQDEVIVSLPVDAVAVTGQLLVHGPKLSMRPNASNPFLEYRGRADADVMRSSNTPSAQPNAEVEPDLASPCILGQSVDLATDFPARSSRSIPTGSSFASVGWGMLTAVNVPKGAASP
jgi:hypothetical protein